MDVCDREDGLRMDYLCCNEKDMMSVNSGTAISLTLSRSLVVIVNVVHKLCANLLRSVCDI